MTRSRLPADRDIEPEVAAIEAALRRLRTAAPASLATSTLLSVGLADAYATMPSPLGAVFVAWNGRGVSAVSAVTAADGEDAAGAAFERRFRDEVGRPLHRVEAAPPRLAATLARRLSGDRRAPVPVDLRGRTAFERAVLEKAAEIPRGEVRPYAWVAREIGRPGAVRAVGTALGHNPVPLVIPCHRVIRGDGTIGQYSMGGPEAKRTVLEAEGLDLDALQDLGAAGIRFLASDTTRIFCLPTCHNARRITDRHRVRFQSAEEGRAAGYRPCRHCRPASAA